jgi:murein hydrolase activator
LKLALVIFSGALAMMSTGPVLAQLNESQEIEKRYNEIRQKLVKDEEERRKVLSELYKVTHVMRKMQHRHDDLMIEKNRLTEKISKAGEKIEQLRGELTQSRGLISNRLRALYKFNGQATMRLIFASQSMAELDRNYKMLKIVLDRDFKMISRHQVSLKKLARQKIQMKQDMSHLARLEKEIEREEDNLVVKQQAKNKILSGFDEATVQKLKSLEDLRTQSSVQARGAIEAAFFEKKGRLLLPVQGILKQKFGTLRDVTSTARLRFKGHFYEAVEGEPIRSIYSGEVSYAGIVDGYGPTVIVSHGDHYYSVYGGLSKLETQEGEKVLSNEVIGAAGRGFHLFDSGLYFEIRHFSDPVNPSEWLAESRREVSFVQGGDN